MTIGTLRDGVDRGEGQGLTKGRDRCGSADPERWDSQKFGKTHTVMLFAESLFTFDVCEEWNA